MSDVIIVPDRYVIVPNSIMVGAWPIVQDRDDIQEWCALRSGAKVHDFALLTWVNAGLSNAYRRAGNMKKARLHWERMRQERKFGAGYMKCWSLHFLHGWVNLPDRPDVIAEVEEAYEAKEFLYA